MKQGASHLHKVNALEKFRITLYLYYFCLYENFVTMLLLGELPYELCLLIHLKFVKKKTRFTALCIRRL